LDRAKHCWRQQHRDSLARCHFIDYDLLPEKVQAVARLI
jgi:hypothetical protein